MRNNKKGFTLAELLIVVAIIAVLVAIAIPVFSSQLEKSREATDLANPRSAYGEAVATALTSSNGSGTSASYTMKQTGTFEASTDDLPNDLKNSSDLSTWKAKTSGNTYTVTVSTASGATTVSIS